MHGDGTTRGLTLTRQDFCHFSLTIARHTRDPDNLASVHLQGDAGQSSMALVIVGGQVGELEANRPLWAALACRLFRKGGHADHHPCEILRG